MLRHGHCCVPKLVSSLDNIATFGLVGAGLCPQIPQLKCRLRDAGGTPGTVEPSAEHAGGHRLPNLRHDQQYHRQTGEERFCFPVVQGQTLSPLERSRTMSKGMIGQDLGVK